MTTLRPGNAPESTVVIGAGPAGTAAAITLARAGRQVTLIDKARFPRDKCCGDGLTAGALRHLDHLGLDPATVPSWMPVDDVWISDPKQIERQFPLPKGKGQFAAIATRSDLDHALVNLARECGVDVREDTAMTHIKLFDDRIAVATDTGELIAHWCIAADGMWSPTRKALGLGQPGYRGEWHAFRQYWKHVGPRASRELFVWFEPDILPGYVWSFPLPNGRANVGFGVLRETHQVGDMADIWPAILDRPHIRDVLGPFAEPESRHKAWPIPARVGDVALTAHRTFFVGDAAAACDPLTGEGIGQALQTGMAAAGSILAGSGDPGEAATSYRREVERELAIDMRFAAKLSPLLGTSLGARGALALTATSPWTRRNFARWLFEDYPRALLGTPRRWRRDAFTKPGAWT